ncbi:hypothetical protein HMPREF9580_02098 [Cutibacterium acnes HL087PA2]|nr:hypothetical protein HMPREF9580_02098 [Cutibacterium acnes HL087PA2]
MLPLGPGGVQSGAVARGTKFHFNRRPARGTTRGNAARIIIGCNNA